MRSLMGAESLGRCLAAAGISTWEYDVDSRELFFSPGSFSLFGMSEEEGRQLGAARRCLERIEPNDLEAMLREARSVKHGQELRLDCLVKWPDGSVHCVRSVSRLESTPERARLLVGAHWDFTRDWINQQRTCESNNRLQALAHTFPDMTFRIDLDGEIIDYKAPEQDSGLLPPAADILGQRIDDLPFPPAVRDQFRASVQCAIATGAVQYFDYSMDVPGAMDRHFEARVLGYGRSEAICIVRDITDRRVAENALVESMKAAEAATRAKTEFLATMSHEIRTPMNGVIGMAQVLATTALDEEQRECVDVITHSGEVLLTLINDILDYSKIEAGRLNLESVNVDIANVITDCRGIIGTKAKEKGIELTASLAADMPRTFIADPTRLRQILINLLGNAVKFTNKGKVHLEVTASEITQEDALLRLSVQDTGVGIPADRISSLFQRFVQADGSTTRRFGGTGLGLAICKQLVEIMGGRIWVESVLGKGSTFVAELRLRRGGREVARATPASTQPVGRRRSRVLLAEDNLVNRKVACKMLGRLGIHDVDIAGDGLAAVAQAGLKDYDLVLMDVQMPELDGLEATRRIRAEEDGPRPLIIAMTANASIDDRARCLEAGMDDFLSKPISWTDLQATLDRWLGPSPKTEILESAR